MKEDPSETSARGIDAILSRYVSVWLWSILFGANTGLSYSFLTIRSDRALGITGMLFATLMILGLVCVVASWSALYRYLVRFLIPSFLIERNVDMVPEQRLRAAFYLKRAFTFMLTAVIVRLVVGIAEIFAFSVSQVFIGGRGF